MEKFETIVTNWENGNLGTAQKSMKALSKVELMDFTTYCVERMWSFGPIEVIKKIRNMIA